MIEAYLINVLIFVGIYLILAVSLNLALGYTGLLNLGHIAFYGVGAYTSALLTTRLELPFVFSFILAGLFAAIFGYILVLATNKLKGEYLALATLGFNFLIYSLMINWSSLTNGPLGVSSIPRPSLFSLIVKSNFSYLIFTAIIAVICILTIRWIAKSPFGRLLEATRDDELGLRVLGKNTYKLKQKSMIFSSFFAGIAGSLFAHYTNYIDPAGFLLTEIILIVTIVIVGGIASIKGSIAATFVIILIPEILRFLSLPTHLLGPARQIVYALLLLGILLFRPRGLFGRVDLE